MKKLFIFIFLLSVFDSSAQSPGYMGKRFVLTHYSFYFPAFKQPSYRSTQGLKMNVTKAVGIDFAAYSRSSICVAVQYVLTGISYQSSTGYNYNYILHKGDPTIPAKVSVIQYSVGLKKFNRRAVSSIGFYLKWEMLFQQYTIKYDKEGFYSYGNYYSSYVPLYKEIDGGSGIVKVNGIGSAFGIGKQRIFWDKLVVDYGVRGSLCVPLPHKISNPVEASMASKAYERILSSQLLNLKIGIGFLAF